MKKFLVTLALLSMTILILGGCLEKLPNLAKEQSTVEEPATAESAPETTAEYGSEEWANAQVAEANKWSNEYTKMIEDYKTKHKASILASIEDWQGSYEKTKDLVGDSGCKDQEYVALQEQINKGDTYTLKGSELGVLRWTSNYSKISTEKFLGFTKNCFQYAGGPYPFYAYADKLIWINPCSTGVMPYGLDDPTLSDMIKCNAIYDIVQEFYKDKE